MNPRAALIGSLVATACTPNDPGACDGGGYVTAAIGVEAVVGQFEPYEDGDTVPVADGPSLSFDYEVTGLNAEDVVTVVLRLSRPGTGTTDYLANADMRCSDPGPARYGATAPWPDTWADPATLDGTTITVDTVFTDVQAISAEVDVDLVVDANP